MDWFLQLIGFGVAAFFMFIFSVSSAEAKRYKAGLLFGGLELLSAAVSSGAWAYALKISGKTDWFLFGLFGYTPIALICIAMFVVGIGCVAVNARGLSKGSVSTTPAD